MSQGKEGWECVDGVCRKVDKQSDSAAASTLKLGAYDVGQDYIVLEWNSLQLGSKFSRYQIQMQVLVAIAVDNSWQTLSTTLQGPFVKKKGLEAGNQYRFRIRGFDEPLGKWQDEYTEPIVFETVDDSSAPFVPTNVVVESKESMSAAAGLNKFTVRWDVPKGYQNNNSNIIYALEYKQMGQVGVEWTVASLKITSNVVAKKNIPQGQDWVFRVQAKDNSSGDENGTWGRYSKPSEPTMTVVLNQTLAQLFRDDNCLVNQQLESVASATLAGKVVMLYFSASWCPPCRQFTPMLASYYNQLKKIKQPAVEIIFVSADKDNLSFLEYFTKKMPFLAIAFSSPTRDRVKSKFRVDGIPCLKVFNPRGRLVCDNAVPELMQANFDLGLFQKWSSSV